MDKIFAALHKMTLALGGGKRWQVGKVTVYLWPFVAMTIFIAAILIYHFGFAP